MITSIHTLIYSDDPPATRAFLRDVVEWPCVRDGESEPPWLIFRSGPSEMGVHPTHSVWEGRTYDSPRHHEISLMCDDLDTTMADLAAKGATFSGPTVEEDYGRIAMLEVPGTDPIMLYQPKHVIAYSA
jgi:predicted enzyme related to lactoylglutathione lyase